MLKLHAVRDFLEERLWRTDLETLPWQQRLVYHILRLGYVLARELYSGQLNLRAMSLVYTTLLSIVPVLALSFSVLKGLGVHNQIEPMLSTFLMPLGEKGPEISAQMIGFVDRMQVGVLGTIGVAFLIYTVVALIQKIESAFNHVWQIHRNRSLARRFSDYLSVALIGPVLVFSAMGMTASVSSSALVQSMMAVQPLGALLLALGKLVPFLFIIAAFTFFYIFIPNTRVQWRAALIGGVVGGVLWQSLGMAFAGFVSSASNYTAIYSGLAILILFMIWLYLSWFILLFGAQVAYFTQNPDQVRREREPSYPGARDFERVALAVMVLVTQRHREGGAPWTLEGLSEALQLPGEELRVALEALEQLGILRESCDEETGYLPGRDPETVKVAELWRGLRGLGSGASPRMPEAVEGLVLELEARGTEALDGLTLKGLALGQRD